MFGSIVSDMLLKKNESEQKYHLENIKFIVGLFLHVIRYIFYTFA